MEPRQLISTCLRIPDQKWSKCLVLLALDIPKRLLPKALGACSLTPNRSADTEVTHKRVMQCSQQKICLNNGYSRKHFSRQWLRGSGKLSIISVPLERPEPMSLQTTNPEQNTLKLSRASESQTELQSIISTPALNPKTYTQNRQTSKKASRGAPPVHSRILNARRKLLGERAYVGFRGSLFVWLGPAKWVLSTRGSGDVSHTLV